MKRIEFCFATRVLYWRHAFDGDGGWDERAWIRYIWKLPDFHKRKHGWGLRKMAKIGGNFGIAQIWASHGTLDGDELHSSRLESTTLIIYFTYYSTSPSTQHHPLHLSLLSQIRDGFTKNEEDGHTLKLVAITHYDTHFLAMKNEHKNDLIYVMTVGSERPVNSSILETFNATATYIQPASSRREN